VEAGLESGAPEGAKAMVDRTAKGCPSFVTEPAGTGLAQFPEALRSTRRYVRNVALWLSRRARR